MKIKAEANIDIINLFLKHRCNAGPFDEEWLASYLTQKLASCQLSEYSHVEICAPEMNSYFRLEWAGWADEEYSNPKSAGGLGTKADFKLAVPGEIYKALLTLNKK